MHRGIGHMIRYLPPTYSTSPPQYSIPTLLQTSGGHNWRPVNYGICELKFWSVNRRSITIFRLSTVKEFVFSYLCEVWITEQDTKKIVSNQTNDFIRIKEGVSVKGLSPACQQIWEGKGCPSEQVWTSVRIGMGAGSSCWWGWGRGG